MKTQKIAIGNDHSGVVLKEAMIYFLKMKGFEILNFGTDSGDSVDYPDYVHPLVHSVQNKEVDYGILICGSGQGVAMTANKHQEIRAAVCWNPMIAELARKHNNSNVLCLPARFLAVTTAYDIANKFLRTAFEGGRHQTRVEKMIEL